MLFYSLWEGSSIIYRVRTKERFRKLSPWHFHLLTFFCFLLRADKGAVLTLSEIPLAYTAIQISQPYRTIISFHCLIQFGHISITSLLIRLTHLLINYSLAIVLLHVFFVAYHVLEGCLEVGFIVQFTHQLFRFHNLICLSFLFHHFCGVFLVASKLSQELFIYQIALIDIVVGSLIHSLIVNSLDRAPGFLSERSHYLLGLVSRS